MKLPQMTASPLKAAEPQETAEKISVPGKGWIRKGREQRRDAKAHGTKNFMDLKKFVKKGGKVFLQNTSRRLYECTFCGVVTVNKGHPLQPIELSITLASFLEELGERESARAHVQ